MRSTTMDPEVEAVISDAALPIDTLKLYFALQVDQYVFASLPPVRKAFLLCPLIDNCVCVAVQGLLLNAFLPGLWWSQTTAGKAYKAI